MQTHSRLSTQSLDGITAPPNPADEVATFAAFAAARGPLPRVCLVTGELVGPFKNGGLGTSMTGLVELLAAEGGDVTVLYTGDVIGDIGVWRSRYRDAGIRLETLHEMRRPNMVGPLVTIGWTNAWVIYDVLKARSFDVIHFNDTVGEGVYCFLAKRLGQSFKNTLLTLALHSPTEWILESNGHPSNWPGFCCFTTAERLSIAATDVLWAPSLYLLSWLKQRHYALPRQVYNQQYVIPTAEIFSAGREKIARAAAPPENLASRKPKEIVFFGRLEERKGIRLFVSAITRLGPELERRGVSVLFMGKPSSVSGRPADEFLRERSAKWPFKWRIESGFDQRHAVAYLRSNDCVAVMASPVDNSPCTVYEALQFGLPFIAAKTGGIPELIHEDDRDRHLFAYTVAALCASILDVLDRGISNARPAVSVAENQARWLGMHRSWRTFLPDAAPRAAVPKWSVLIDHAGDADRLTKTIKSVRERFDRDCRIAVVQHDLARLPSEGLDGITVVDDASDATAAEIVSDLSWSGAEALLMLRSGFEIAAEARATFDASVHFGADISVPMTAIKSVDAVMPMLAGSAALGWLEGDYDSGGIVVNIAALKRLLGPDLAALDRSRTYLGVVEEVYGADGEVWPIPAVLLSAQTGADVVLTEMSEAKRAMAFAKMRHAERYQVLAIGRHAYRARSYVRTPRPPSFVRDSLAAVARTVPGLANSNFKRVAAKALAQLSGARAPAVIAQIKRWLRLA